MVNKKSTVQIPFEVAEPCESEGALCSFSDTQSLFFRFYLPAVWLGSILTRLSVPASLLKGGILHLQLNHHEENFLKTSSGIRYPKGDEALRFSQPGNSAT